MTLYPVDKLIVGEEYFTNKYGTSCFMFDGMEGLNYRFTQIFSSISYRQNVNGFYYFAKTIWWSTKFKYGK